MSEQDLDKAVDELIESAEVDYFLNETVDKIIEFFGRLLKG